MGRGSFPLEALPPIARRDDPIAPDLVRRLYAPGVRYAVRDIPEVAGFGQELFERQGFKDGLGMVSMEPDRTGVVISATIPAFGHYLPPRTLKQLERFSAHLASAVRLRNAPEKRDSEHYRQALIKRRALRAAVLATLEAQRLDAFAYPTLRRKPALRRARLTLAELTATAPSRTRPQAD